MDRKKSSDITIDDQIEIVTDLLEGVKELNGEYQEGWDESIEKGEKLLTHLKWEAIREAKLDTPLKEW